MPHKCNAICSACQQDTTHLSEEAQHATSSIFLWFNSRAYDRAAVRMRGDTATLNFPDTNYTEDPFVKVHLSLNTCLDSLLLLLLSQSVSYRQSSHKSAMSSSP